jgi:DNA/RNA-binding domain of Phe-tRNA-synthetase-like protein
VDFSQVVELKLHQIQPGLRAGLVQATNAQVADSPPELRTRAQQVVSQTLESGLPGGDRRRTAIRELLRAGGFKPSGRNKPAQEYLLRHVRQENALPCISNAVDLINLVSISSGLPISLISLDRIGWRLQLRYGAPKESYVFNASGQELDLSGLLTLCRAVDDGSDAVATPVKDSMEAKVGPEDHNLLACVYSSAAAIKEDELNRWLHELADGFRSWCNAEQTRVWVESS